MADHAAVLDAAERYAAGLAAKTGEPHFVNSELRGWHRIFADTPQGRAIVCFVGASSGGIYSAKTWTKYGVRTGNVFTRARELEAGGLA